MASSQSLSAQLSALRLCTRHISPLSSTRRFPRSFLPLQSIISTQSRNASHAAQASASRGSRDGPGKRLGAKKVGGELVVPGNIIYRQRGTKWFPGENCDMGRDHTIFAMQKGYVRYYDDASTGPKKRRYIGVVFDKADVLPYPPNAPRRRRLGMVAYSRENGDGQGEEVSEANLRLWERKDNTPVQGRNKDGRLLSMRSDYSFREYGWEIGKVMDEAAEKIRPFDHKDRWLAWRKRQTAWKRKTEERRLAASSKKGGTQKAKRKGSAKPRTKA